MYLLYEKDGNTPILVGAFSKLQNLLNYINNNNEEKFIYDKIN